MPFHSLSQDFSAVGAGDTFLALVMWTKKPLAAAVVFVMNVFSATWEETNLLTKVF
jgi:hypothetical protein